jgi:hypothetical protein
LENSKTLLFYQKGLEQNEGTLILKQNEQRVAVSSRTKLDDSDKKKIEKLKQQLEEEKSKRKNAVSAIRNFKCDLM